MRLVRKYPQGSVRAFSGACFLTYFRGVLSVVVLPAQGLTVSVLPRLLGRHWQTRGAPACVAEPAAGANLSLCSQTLGHLEKAVVLELTLKHVKALTNLIEQQQQKIIALQNGLQAGECSNGRVRSCVCVMDFPWGACEMRL